MSKPSLGTKQVCPSCESKFYDLNKIPAICPKCGHSFDPADNAVLSMAAQIKEKEATEAVSDMDDDEEQVDETEIDEETDIEAAKELGGDDEEIVRDAAGDKDDDDDDASGSEPLVPQGFSEDDMDDEDAMLADDDDDAFNISQPDIGIDEDFDNDDTPPTQS